MAYDGSEFQELDDVPIQQIARDEIFKAAIRTQETWRAILDEAGWVDEGNAKADITISPQGQGADEYEVGGDIIQLIIAEYGRRPGAPMPPHKPIAEWVHRQAGMPSQGDDGFDNTVFNVRQHIAENGLEPIRAGARAFRRESERAQESVDTEIDEAME